MPYITIQSGKLPDPVKEKLLKGLTATAVEITGYPLESFFITINEIPDENIAIGGKTIKELKKIK